MLLFGKNRVCITCTRPCNKNGTYVHYEIKNTSGKAIGKMDMHRTQECFVAGSTTLRHQHEQSVNADLIEATSHIGNKKYKLLLARQEDYFVIPLYIVSRTSKGTQHVLRKDMFKFLQECVNRDTLIMIFFKSLKNTPEAYIPLLASVNEQIIPHGLLSNPEYQSRKSKAINELKTSMTVRGNDPVQLINIMYQYMQETAIML